LFFASKENEKWSNEVPFHLNSPDYSVGHGCLNDDGTVMYFSSDMPGGYGGVDLYKIEKGIDGKWGEAINLGDVINTEANEMFPFYEDKSNLLFFASNGHIGLGGLDIFYSNDNNGTYSSATNVGAPMNTNSDDFSFIIDDEMKHGYFSSNREGGKGDDDIYHFNLNFPFETTNVVSGTIVSEDDEAIQNVEVVLLNEKGEVVDEIITSADGKYNFKVKPDEKYTVGISKEKYKTLEVPVGNSSIAEELNITLEKEDEFSVFSVIKNEATGKPVEGAQVTLKNTETNVAEDFTTDKFGKFSKGCENVKVDDLASYEIVIKKDGYITKTIQVEKRFTKNGELNLSEGHNFTLVKIEAGADLGKLINVNAIYFDYNKFTIRSDAKIELDKIVTIMNEYPMMEIELGSHTDCRGKKSYNEWLSDERAKASAKYIKSKITNPSRIYGKGYGEAKVINKCECEGARVVPCTDDEHQENRRTEFKVISMGGANVKNSSPDSFGK